MIKCIECGTEFDESIKTCPNCGCPVQDNDIAEEKINTSAQVVPRSERKTSPNFKINIMAIISLVIGIVILITGFTVKNKKFDIETYTATKYSADYAEFGADFYTYIYEASDIAVDAISAVNGGIASLSNSIAEYSEIITYSAGMIIVAIGAGVIAVSAMNIIKKED